MRLVNTIRDLQPDIIHCHFESLIRFLHYTPGKKVLTVHGISRQYDKILSKYDMVFGITHDVCTDLARRGLNAMPVLVYNGIDHTLIKTKTRYDKPEFRIVCVGRLNHQTKGQDLLLMAIHEIIYAHSIKNINVHFLGDGPSLCHLLNLAHQLDIAPYCKFIGFKPRNWVFHNLCNYELLVQPSRREAFGLSIAEAMMAKVPVLVSNIPGATEVINRGNLGYKFEAEDSHDCARAIIDIMKAYSNKEIKSMTEAAYNYAVSHFAISDISKQYLNQYRLLLTK